MNDETYEALKAVIKVIETDRENLCCATTSFDEHIKQIKAWINETEKEHDN